MKKSTDAFRIGGAGLFFSCGVLLALLAGFMVFRFMTSAVKTEKVLVIARDLPPGATITNGDIVEKDIPSGGVPDAALKDRAKAVGQRVRLGVIAGEIIRSGHLVKKGGDVTNQVAGLGEEYRAVSLSADLVPVFNRLVPGDQLELTGVFPYAEKGSSTTITVPLGNATVLDVSRPDADRSFVLVAVKAEQAAHLALTMRSGGLMVSVLPLDKMSSPAPGMRLDELVSGAGGVTTTKPTNQTR